MGIDYYIGDDDSVNLASYSWYNEFENWVADIAEQSGDDYPQILDHSNMEGSYVHNKDQEATLLLGSIPKLREEVVELLDQNPPAYCKYILERMLEGITMAEMSGSDISLDSFETIPEEEEGE